MIRLINAVKTKKWGRMISNPLVSIVLTTYNCDETLSETLNAIEQQDYPDIEVIIKDGVSTDNTIEIIKRFEKNSKYFVKWSSQKDIGIYDAMNQGYQLTKGDIIVFCSDKLIAEDAVSCMVRTIINAGTNCIGAHADLVYTAGKVVKRYWHMGKGKIQDGWMPGHPTLFLKRKVYEKYGLFKTDYCIAADYEFMIRILKNEAENLEYVPKIIVSMYYGGTSTGNAGSYVASLKEANRALKENGIRCPWKVSFLRTIRLIRQFQKSREREK